MRECMGEVLLASHLRGRCVQLISGMRQRRRHFQAACASFRYGLPALVIAHTRCLGAASIATGAEVLGASIELCGFEHQTRPTVHASMSEFRHSTNTLDQSWMYWVCR